MTGTVPERAGAGPATETASQGATGARGGSRSRAQVLDRLRALYAEALEYPPDVLTDAAGLEADLGVDSLKQTALLRRVMEEFALDDPPGSLNLATLGTLADVADHVMSSKPVQEAAA
ncbi:acyl carrier protein [Streptomyces gilvosporeus]|uniref:acyl carrier protein n=1 Tax=Streptomyces gilvosporeus TaxID=553510 RepID=UPI002150303B|nr:acyl carrier protein [Streptomyces gilvosporeus]